jgi:hypothetical protein
VVILTNWSIGLIGDHRIVTLMGVGTTARFIVSGAEPLYRYILWALALYH